MSMFNCNLQVPEGSENAYQTANQWRDFFHIEGVNDVHRLFYDGADADGQMSVDVYTIDGTLVGRGMNAATVANELPKGLYVINGKKVLIK